MRYTYNPKQKVKITSADEEEDKVCTYDAKFIVPMFRRMKIKLKYRNDKKVVKPFKFTCSNPKADALPMDVYGANKEILVEAVKDVLDRTLVNNSKFAYSVRKAKRILKKIPASFLRDSEVEQSYLALIDRLARKMAQKHNNIYNAHTYADALKEEFYNPRKQAIKMFKVEQQMSTQTPLVLNDASEFGIEKVDVVEPEEKQESKAKAKFKAMLKNFRTTLSLTKERISTHIKAQKAKQKVREPKKPKTEEEILNEIVDSVVKSKRNKNLTLDEILNLVHKKFSKKTKKLEDAKSEVAEQEGVSDLIKEVYKPLAEFAKENDVDPKHIFAMYTKDFEANPDLTVDEWLNTSEIINKIREYTELERTNDNFEIDDIDTTDFDLDQLFRVGFDTQNPSITDKDVPPTETQFYV